MNIERTLGDSSEALTETVVAKFTKADVVALDARVEEMVGRGIRASRSALLRALLRDYLEQDSHADDG